ncbi:MAG: hypothetical protein ACTHMI_24380 [Mucilaginibacter sp.]
MESDINKKITIDVEVNTDGQQQIALYKAAIDNLRTSVNNLSNPLTGLSNHISILDKNLSKANDSLNKLSKQNKEAESSGQKVKESIKGVGEAFDITKKITDLLKASFENLEGALTGGISIIIAYLPELTNWISSLIKGKEAADATKLSAETMNQAIDNSDYSNAVAQVNNLKINVELAKQGLIDKKEVLQQYNETLGKTMGQADNLGQVESLLTKNGPAYIKMTLLKAAAQTALQNAAKKAVEAEKDKIKSDEDSLTFWDKAKGYIKTGIAAVGSPVLVLEEYTSVQAENIATAKRRRKEAVDDADKQQKEYLKFAETFTKRAAEIAKESGFDLFNGEIVPKSTAGPKKKKAKIERREPVELSAPVAKIPTAKITENLNTVKSMQLTNEQDTAKKTVDIKKSALDKIEDYAKQNAQKIATDAIKSLRDSVKQQEAVKLASLEKDKSAELANKSLTSAQRLAIENKYKKKEAAIKAKAFKDEQKASIAQALINGAIAVTKAEAQTGVLGALVIPGIIGQTAIQVAKIAAQKPPAYAHGGYFKSDGKGALLPGYSRTDNTNAYLRSGEAVVVSEAMQVPWARNLVSAINVGFGGRDFSVSNNTGGFAVGGIFTDGGNANRYYNQPVNDQKNLANTIAYQMINNFPPVYVDVKDINNQQNILAQTINRVNL